MSLSKALRATLTVLAVITAAPAYAGTGACGAAYIAPSASSYSPNEASDGTLISSANATGPAAGWAAASLPVNLPQMSAITSPWTICGLTDANNAVVFNAPLLSAPTTPSLGSTTGGSIGATTYYVKITYTNAAGETLPSAEASLAVGASHLLTVTTPGAYGNAAGYNVYAATGSGSEKKQNTSPISLASNWTEAIGGLASGAVPPSAGTAPAAYILDGGQQLATYVAGTGNYQAVTLVSDGANYRVPLSSNESRRINGATTTLPSRWVYPGGPGYAATQGDNGNVITTDATTGGLAITLPSTTAIAGGWSVFVVATSEPGTIQVNGTSGGAIVQANAQTTSELAFRAGNAFFLMFDGANFRSYPLGAPAQPGVIYVTDPMFGAKCDGVTGDSTAIQAALRYAQTNGLTLGFPSAKCVLDTAVTGNGLAITINWNSVTLLQTHSGTGFTLTQAAVSGGSNWVVFNGIVNFVAYDAATASAAALNLSFPVGVQSYPTFDSYGKINCLSSQAVQTTPYPYTYTNCLTGVGFWNATIYGLQYVAGLTSPQAPITGTSAIYIGTRGTCSGTFTIDCYSSVGLGIYNFQSYGADQGLALHGYTEGTYLVEPQILGNWGVKVGNATVDGTGTYNGSSGIIPLNYVNALVIRITGGEFGTLRDSIFCDQCFGLDMVRAHFDPSSDGTDPVRNVTLVDSDGSILDGNWTTGGASTTGSTAILLAIDNLGSGYNRIRGTVTLSGIGVTIQPGNTLNDTDITATPGVIPISDTGGQNADCYNQAGMKTCGNTQINGSITFVENAYNATPVSAATSGGIFDNLYGLSDVDIFNTSTAGNGTVVFGGLSALDGGKFQTGTISTGGWNLPLAESYVGGRIVLGAPVQQSASGSVSNIGYDGFSIAAMSKYVPHAVGVGCVDQVGPVGGVGTAPSYCVTDTQVSNAAVSVAGTGGSNSTSTTLNGTGAIPGQTVVGVASTGGFSGGQTVDIQLNSASCTAPVACFFETTVASVGSGTVTLSSPMPLSAAAGNKIFVAQTVTGTGGTGVAATYSVDIESGGIHQVLQVHGGDYTVNPSGCSGTSCVQPVTGAGLSGSPALTINTGALYLGQASPGSLTVPPPTAATISSGAGTGLVMTITFANGVGSVNAQNGYYQNGTPGVSCPSGVNATTVTVAAGIITHC